jgi:Carbamoyl-phosphate synthase L chain, ATP binding domain
MTKMLMIALEPGRWGPSRLLSPLTDVGFEIAVFCPSSNPIRQSSHVARHFELPNLKSWRVFTKQLNNALNDWQPTIIMPCDEQVIAAIHFIIRRKLSGIPLISDLHLRVLLDSIGSADKLDAMIFKNETRDLAIANGVKVPTGARVGSAKAAVELAQKLSFPVFVKKSFSWGGQGTILCQDDADVVRAYHQLNPKYLGLKNFIRKTLSREWYPTNSATEVQRALPGISSMFNVVAWRGQYLGGFFGRREQTLGGNGPSTIVMLGQNEACEASAKKMVAAMGISGFCAFDFMWDEATGSAVLLECNPRPNQVSHLGPSIGVDMCAALAKACAGEVVPIAPVTNSTVVPLFPQEWLRDEQSALTKRRELDIPLRDRKLLEFMLNEGLNRGRSIEKLKLFPA